ncbi:hypothetical protein B0I00_0467 [Novosphingobium kunmingense]|uniref:Uncharacterized protein n=2 Tax=Novosphingobium kunmingense TaxID=1211806 RepID=A0A2N0I260_9SPHN|nr:hypothetical protein B0I00_0467 [Novosphingobium kunmingense]
MREILDIIEAAAVSAPSHAAVGPFAPTRLHTLLADGTDRMATRFGLERGYEIVAPLPFGRRLNRAINSLTTDPAEARRLLAGDDALDPLTQSHAAEIRDLSDKAHVFSLADADEEIARLFLAKLDKPEDATLASLFAAETSRRVALAGRILIEQSDLVIGVWDGATTAHVGGTGHTIAVALELGSPVIWIDPSRPDRWRILLAPEALTTVAIDPPTDDRVAVLTGLVHAALDPGSDEAQPGFTALLRERWHGTSNPLAHGYRRVEALFGGDTMRQRLRSLRQRYERPEQIQTGSGSAFLCEAAALPGADTGLVERIGAEVMRRAAWSDGISAHLSDAYRGGMTFNFVLSSLSIVAGIMYLPFVGVEDKWMFALAELVLLSGILIITIVGQRRRYHTRWFETRRVAEYFRHAPLMMILGVSRPPGRWPHGADASWPEFYVRQVLREVGLPRMAMSAQYVRDVLLGPLASHVRGQRDYHFGKAKRLATVHHRLDVLSEGLFQLAVGAVTLYLVLRSFESAGAISPYVFEKLSKVFTVLGVAFPTFGAGVAGVRYFGDFERFGEISEVTAEKLDGISKRIDILASAPPSAVGYGEVTELAHAADDIVVAELESWQAVFGGKQIAVPV